MHTVLIGCRYDPLSSCLVDFKGRANMASVKNFQLIESLPECGFGAGSTSRNRFAPADESKEVILLQMGKVSAVAAHDVLLLLCTKREPNKFKMH